MLPRPCCVWPLKKKHHALCLVFNNQRTLTSCLFVVLFVVQQHSFPNTESMKSIHSILCDSILFSSHRHALGYIFGLYFVYTFIAYVNHVQFLRQKLSWTINHELHFKPQSSYQPFNRYFYFFYFFIFLIVAYWENTFQTFFGFWLQCL